MTNSRLDNGLIAALATPLGQSALAVIRTSGNTCIETMATIFSRPSALLSASGHSMVHGNLINSAIPGDRESVVDEVMLAVFRSPRSYSGEDSVEIYCHGSIPGIDRIFALLFANGFRQAQGGEFTLRAFLNGKLDLTQAEAVQEIVTARSRTAQSLALHRLGGAVFARIDQQKQDLIRLMAMVSIQLDYPDDEIDTIELPLETIIGVRQNLNTLAETYRIGRTYQQGVRLTLAGRTNAGKSSLFNALVREERAIVSEIHGTTRDYLEAPFAIRGIPVRLFDTAGLREVQEVLESEGIRRSGMVISAAALVIYVIDVTTAASQAGIPQIHPDDRKHLEEIHASGIPVMIAWNKVDTLQAAIELPDCGFPAFSISAKNLTGLEVLMDAIADTIMEGSKAEDADVIIDSERQYQLLLRAVNALGQVTESLHIGVSLDLVALDLQEALNALGEITGEVSSEDVLDAVFSGFCVGK